MTNQEKFNALYQSLKNDLNSAFEVATTYQKYSSFTSFVDPSNMATLKLIATGTQKGCESFNDVARSIMRGERIIECINTKNSVVDFYENNYA